MADLKDFFAGFFAGIFSLSCSHPLDTLKVRQQAYKCSIFAALKNTYKYDGIKGFYKGITFPLLTYGPCNSMFFGVYGNWLKYLGGDDPRNPTDKERMKKIFTAGCVAGVPQSIFYAPVEYIKILLQTNTITEGRWKPHYATPYTGVGEAIRGIYKQSGVRGFFRGCWVMCLRDVPTSGVYVLSYELLRSSIPDIVGKEILAGGTAGIISLVPALPLDVIKTNIQTDNPKNPYYKGILDCIRKMYAKNGFPVFFTGLPILCMRAFPANAVMFTSYELLMAL